MECVGDDGASTSVVVDMPGCRSTSQGSWALLYLWGRALQFWSFQIILVSVRARRIVANSQPLRVALTGNVFFHAVVAFNPNESSFRISPEKFGRFAGVIATSMQDFFSIH